MRTKMPNGYEDLAKLRVKTRWPGYQQPEDFGYDFRDWVSPYTKSAHAVGGVALVLQDWASADHLIQRVNPATQKYGRDPEIITNKRLARLLDRIFHLSLDQVYVTNAFPFVKPGGKSSSIPQRDVLKAVELFTIPELDLARPRLTIALVRLARRALSRAGVPVVSVPHPAARIGGDQHHESQGMHIVPADGGG